MRELCYSIDQAVEAENHKGGNPYILAITWGYVIYDRSIHRNGYQLIQAADQAMYANKEAFLNIRRFQE